MFFLCIEVEYFFIVSKQTSIVDLKRTFLLLLKIFFNVKGLIVSQLRRMAVLFSIMFFHAHAESIYIQQKQTLLKEAPSFLAKTVATCKYGDEVKVIEEKEKWKKVSFGTKKGWIFASAAVDTLNYSSGASNAPSSVSSNEVMLAGKGFNKQVESTYREENPKLRFDLVDAMEKESIKPQVQSSFAQVGQLKQ